MKFFIKLLCIVFPILFCGIACFAVFVSVFSPKLTSVALASPEDCAPAACEKYLRGSFSTTFRSSTPNRKNNIAVAAKSLNVVLAPDEVFSFNKRVGKRTEERGFLPAPIIVDGKFVDGVGGGVCQVSTTLYNAVLLADLEVLCVHRHSLSVGYVSPSRDAMVSSTSDFVFINSTASPVTVSAVISGDKLTVCVYGDMKTREVVPRSVVTETREFEVERVLDGALFVGESKVVTRGKNGIKSKLMLDIYENGKLVGTRLLRVDGYKPQKQVVLVGNKENPTHKIADLT